MTLTSSDFYEKHTPKQMYEYAFALLSESPDPAQVVATLALVQELRALRVLLEKEELPVLANGSSHRPLLDFKDL